MLAVKNESIWRTWNLSTAGSCGGRPLLILVEDLRALSLGHSDETAALVHFDAGLNQVPRHRSVQVQAVIEWSILETLGNFINTLLTDDFFDGGWKCKDLSLSSGYTSRF